jgi:hypothetical protein
MVNRHRQYMYPEGDQGAAGGQGGQQQGGGQQGGGQQGQQQPSAADARTFLVDYVHDPEFLKSVPDEKVVPWYERVKTKVDEFGKQFPQDWRKLVAGENADHLKTLERFQSPKAMFDSFVTMRQKMSSGELLSPFPEKGTDQEKAEWLRIAGIPEKPEDYKILAPQGVEITDEDKSVFANMAKTAHAAHMRPEHFNAYVSWWLQEKDTRADALYVKNEQARMAAEEALRSEWGQDYKANTSRISALLDLAPKGVKEKVLTARTAEGTALLNDADFARFMVDVARQLNPAGVVLPGAGGNIAQSVEDEIKDIEKFMRTNRSEYNRDEKKQSRLRELYAARDKLGKKAA